MYIVYVCIYIYIQCIYIYIYIQYSVCIYICGQRPLWGPTFSYVQRYILLPYIYIHSVYIYILYIYICVYIIYVYIIYHVFLRAFPKVANFFEVRRHVLKQPAQPGSTQSFLGVSEASMLVKLYIYI